jgi:hypothetical protein
VNAVAPLCRDKLAAVLSRLESPYDGERAAAGLLAARMVRGAGLSWPDVVAGLPAAPRAALDDWRGAVATCQARPELLTPWEADFLRKLATYREAPSARQAEILEGIFGRACGG